MQPSNPDKPKTAQTTKQPETAEDFASYAEQLLGGASATKDVEKPTRPKADKQNNTMTFQDKVNGLIKEVTVDEETGKYIYPENTPEELRYAVAAEKKFRDTQAGFTKSQMSLKEAEAEAKALREQLTNNSVTALEIPEDKLEELEELKFTDPDKWRTEMNSLEIAHKAKTQESLKEQLGEVRSKVGAQFELDRRIEVLSQFNNGRKTPVTIEVLDNDIPPRISKKLADGLVTFEGYLAEVDEYLNKGKVVSNPQGDRGTSLSNSAGSATPPSESYGLESGTLDYASLTL